jgi:enolase
MSNLIVDLCARKVVDSRAEMSIEVDVIAEYSAGRASAPLGAPGAEGSLNPQHIQKAVWTRPSR